jgi:hypothetical protein
VASALGPTDVQLRELRLTRGGIALEAVYPLLGLPIEVRLAGRLALDGGRLLADLDEVTLNGTDAPPVVRQQLARLAGEFADRLNRRAEFSRLDLSQGYLQLGGRYRPRQ